MDALLAILNNPMVLAGIGLVIKFVPGVRTLIANRLIPLILSVVAWLANIVGPAEAHAMGGPLHIMALPLFGLGGILGGLGSAVWQAAQAWALNEMFLRHAAPKKPADSK